MLKIRIRTLIPIRRDPKKRDYLKPGEYEALVNNGGAVCVISSYGCYEILPGQFEVIKAPKQLFEFWRYAFHLLNAQALYNLSKTYSAACVLQSAQGKYETAKNRFEKLFNEEGVKS